MRRRAHFRAIIAAAGESSMIVRVDVKVREVVLSTIERPSGFIEDAAGIVGRLSVDGGWGIGDHALTNAESTNSSGELLASRQDLSTALGGTPVVRRRAFVAAATAFLTIPRVARATGGFDVDAPESNARMRVLLATGSFAEPEPVDAWHFSWNGENFRGSFTTVTLPDGRPGLVNVLPLDAYLYGVLGKEISAGWPPESQRAQAILSRTYALGKLRPEKAYDVSASESDQHYGGMSGESVTCRAAIDATAGKIVTYENLPAHVAYSSCCGGMTADAGDIWRTPFPYLTSVADPNCAGSPNFEWAVDVAYADALRSLGTKFRGLGTLRGVRVDTVAPQTRPIGIAFIGTVATVQLSAAEVRNALGTSVVRSTFVHAATFDDTSQTIGFAGTGRGHGVGVCQWGARAMGERGASAEEILSFYLPGTALGRV